MVPPYGSAVTRRTFLAALGATAVGASSGAVTLPGVADAHGHRRHPDASAAKFAVVTDTHIDLDVADRTADLTRVMKHIDGRDPDFVLNCGDISDYGVEDEFARYRSTVPSTLVQRVHHVPGNHEVQWNADAWETYLKVFGATHYGFDAAGLRVIAMDPLVSQQWPPWQFSDQLLAFLETELSSVPPDTPIVVFNHLPLSDDWFFVYNYEKFLSLIEPYPVRMAFAGHTHNDPAQVHTFNGLTQVVGNAVLNGPVYYWAERITDADGGRLVVSEVMVPASGSVTETQIVEAPLGDPGPGGGYGPVDATATLDGETIRLSVGTPADSGVTHVAARLYPQGVPLPLPKPWSSLTGSGQQWNGTLDASALVPGVHRMQVQAGTGQDPVWDAVTSVTVPATTTRVAWTHDLGSQTAMADLAHHGSLVVAATTDGLVEAFTATATGAQQQWRPRQALGGVWKGPVFTPDGGTVLVGSADHNLYALDATSGNPAWQRDLGAPVQCGIAVLAIGTDDRVVVAAGETLYCLALDGTSVWTAGLSGTFTGKAGTDGQRVYAGSGDGNVYAFDAATGTRTWKKLVVDSEYSAYQRVIYGPWAAQLCMLPTGDVLVPMHETISALDPASGAIRWTMPKTSDVSFARVEFTAPTISEYGALIFDGKNGTAYLLDPATGTVEWSDTTLPGAPGAGASWGAAPVPAGEAGTYWMASNSGLLTHIDLTNRKVTALLQLSTAFTTSTAVLVGQQGADQVLVTVDLAGTVRGVVGLENARR